MLEVSSYQIDLAPSLAPTVGMLLNLSPDHIERHGTFEAYAAVKERLIARSDWSLVGVDDRASADVFERAVEREMRLHARHLGPSGRHYPRLGPAGPADRGVAVGRPHGADAPL